MLSNTGHLLDHAVTTFSCDKLLFLRDFGREVTISNRLCYTFELAKGKMTQSCRINYISVVKNVTLFRKENKKYTVKMLGL